MSDILLTLFVGVLLGAVLGWGARSRWEEQRQHLELNSGLRGRDVVVLTSHEEMQGVWRDLASFSFEGNGLLVWQTPNGLVLITSIDDPRVLDKETRDVAIVFMRARGLRAYDVIFDDRLESRDRALSTLNRLHLLGSESFVLDERGWPLPLHEFLTLHPLDKSRVA